MSEPATNLPKRRLRLPTRLINVSWRDLAVVALPTALIVAGAFAIAGHFIRPAPPHTIVMTTGTDGSSFRRYAERYAKILARDGITLQMLPSSGSVENLKRLADPKQHVDVGFVQGGLPEELHGADLVSLGSMFYQPLFVLYRSPEPIARLSQLKGKLIAIGREGSGTEALALALLKANGFETEKDPALLRINGDDATPSILAGRIDAAFLSGDSARPDEIRQLLHTAGLRLFDFAQADAYLQRFRYLNKIALPEGVLDLGVDIPARPIALLAPTVELVARADLHPALSDLLIDAAQEVHGHGSLLARAGEFPSPVERDFPISDDATRYYKAGKSFVYRHLPFWLANLADRLLVLVVPAVVLLIPALRMVPTMYTWRIRTRIFRHYGQLMELERESLRPQSPEHVRRMLAQIDQLEGAVIKSKLPKRFGDEAYVLRQHIDFVRERLTGMAAAQPVQ
ncbi:MAG: ABC transporter substrate-binding protein [Burkholderiaceae bacterium]|nr:ABC transporter substrate-binding protein [Burkholderiaceae bacterium]